MPTTKAELEQLQIDPHEPAKRARCPFCGEDVILGVRKDSRNVTLAHTAVKDPTSLPGEPDKYISGCEPFRAMALRNPIDFLRACRNQGTRWQSLRE